MILPIQPIFNRLNVIFPLLAGGCIEVCVEQYCVWLMILFQILPLIHKYILGKWKENLACNQNCFSKCSEKARDSFMGMIFPTLGKSVWGGGVNVWCMSISPSLQYFYDLDNACFIFFGKWEISNHGHWGNVNFTRCLFKKTDNHK